MAITITVEDGTIVAGANSYVSLDTYESYAEQRGWTTAVDDEDDKASLVRAFDAINRNWEYKGEEVDLENQVGKFPRYIIKNRWEYVTPADEVPQKVQDAQCELAYLIQAGLDPFATVEGVIAAERVKAGPVESETEYQGGYSRPRLVAVEGLLGPYLIAGRGQRQLMRA
ncbi:MAG: hypothetical protein Unbinned7865contig1001_66 [Prokaryotic dsDNA virus sp.]|nr:MAG: hypothetical protein Unbinned7865contig1001_66 [Prokaryotic dsDNA virus sp.]|tara:strand:- start:11766 stop:12275 length:510 start_codon:yes stop_codon:yes gene_type:complete